LYGKSDVETEALDQRTVADELIKRATELSSARITFIEDDSALKNVGGVGACFVTAFRLKTLRRTNRARLY